MVMVMPSNHSIATCLLKKPMGNGINVPVEKMNICTLSIINVHMYVFCYAYATPNAL
jgi:hypothetical protein